MSGSEVTDLHALLPAEPEVAAGEEAGHGVSGQVVDPALLSQLRHDGVDPREARLALCRQRPDRHQRLGRGVWPLL